MSLGQQLVNLAEYTLLSAVLKCSKVRIFIKNNFNISISDINRYVSRFKDYKEKVLKIFFYDQWLAKTLLLNFESFRLWQGSTTESGEDMTKKIEQKVW